MMQRNLAAQSRAHHQLFIVGGGITGACLAHDAALRGLSVMLAEQGDFGAATSSASSKLLHGGIRYLPHGQVWKVRESGRESRIFRRIAPHAAKWLPFLIPTERGSLMKGAAAMKLAMLLYQACGAGLDSLIADPAGRPPEARFLDREAVLERVPALRHWAALEKLTGGQVLWESHMHNSERMTLAFLKSAAANGAKLANYARVERLNWDGVNREVRGVVVRDRLSGEVHEFGSVELVINAAGPWVREVNDAIPALELPHKLTGFSRGVHLVTRRIEPEYALALATRKRSEALLDRGGRHFFVIPWRGCSLIGTTNVPFTTGSPDGEPVAERDIGVIDAPFITGGLDEARVTEKDVADFLAEINAALPGLGLTRADVRYAFTGLYPLVASEIKAATYQGAGDYQVVDHAKSGVGGMLTVLGAKFTTARLVAEKGIDAAMRKLGLPDPGCRTARTPLLEGRIGSWPDFLADCEARFGSCLSRELVLNAARNHGAETPEMLAEGLERGLLDQVAEGRETLAIEIDRAVDREMALTLEDVVFRRTGLGTVGHPGDAALRLCAERMAGPLGWDEAEIRRQLALIEARYQWSAEG